MSTLLSILDAWEDDFWVAGYFFVIASFANQAH